MPGPSFGLFSLELPDPDNEPGHAVRCRPRSWRAGNTSRAMARGLAGEILSRVFTRQQRPAQFDLDLQHNSWLSQVGTSPCYLVPWLTVMRSHINAETPGAIHEGGELGYALAVSFGAVMDNPNLIVPCIVGDGEAESGPTATFVDCFPPCTVQR